MFTINAMQDPFLPTYDFNDIPPDEEVAKDAEYGIAVQGTTVVVGSNPNWLDILRQDTDYDPFAKPSPLFKGEVGNYNGFRIHTVEEDPLERAQRQAAKRFGESIAEKMDNLMFKAIRGEA